jgi:SAM-dependent methyltransferase
MDAQLDQQADQDRISRVYRGWHGGAALARTAWHRPDIVNQQAAMYTRVPRALLAATVGTDLGRYASLDVGCGNGGFLRQLIDWGATPAHLTGTDMQQDRLDLARLRTAPGVRWHCGPETPCPPPAPTWSARTPCSRRPLDPELRQRLAADMWRV